MPFKLSTRQLFTLLLVLFITGCTQPDFQDTDGKGYWHEDLHGAWLVINYWAIWCPPCITEIPELAALNDGHEDVQVFGVNYDDPPPDLMAEQIQKMGITFPVLTADPRHHYNIDRPTVMPTTLVINPQGQLADLLIGPQTEASLLAAMGKTQKFEAQ